MHWKVLDYTLLHFNTIICVVRPTQLQFVDEKISYIIEVKMSAFFSDFRTEQTNKGDTGFFIVSSCYFWPAKNKKGNHNIYYELLAKRDTLVGFTSVHFWVEELLTQFSSLMHLSMWPLLLFLFRMEWLSSFWVDCEQSLSFFRFSKGSACALKWNWSEKFF